LAMTVTLNFIQVNELLKLIAMADNQIIKNLSSKYTVITVGAINYRPVVHNWIHHMKRLNVSNFIVICVDQLIYDELDPDHAILMTPLVHLNLTHVRVNRRQAKRRQKSTLGLPTGEKRRLDNYENTESARSDFQIDSSTRHNQPIVATGPQATEQQMYEDRLQSIGLDKAFSVLMVIKHSAIYALLSAGHSVVWSDVDCIWLRRCTLDYLDAFAKPLFGDYYQSYIADKETTDDRQLQGVINYSLPVLQGRIGTIQKRFKQPDFRKNDNFVDFVSQQGLHPSQMSELIGTAICTGFFVVNPTPGSLILIRAVRNSIVALLASSVQGSGDQKTLNTVLLDQARMYNKDKNCVLSTSSSPVSSEMSSPESQNVVGKFVYGPSLVTGHPKDEMLRMKVRIGTSKAFSSVKLMMKAGRRRSKNEVFPFTVGFLPYDLFPRGDGGVVEYKAPVHPEQIKDTADTEALQSRQIHFAQAGKLASTQQRNADEWNSLSSTACIWHMYSQKTGESKVESMQRDGVFVDVSGEDDERQEVQITFPAHLRSAAVGDGDALDAFHG
jgi:hypothetical protein